MKIEINSDYSNGFIIQNKINERKKLKEELYRLKKSEILRKERNKKLKNINFLCHKF